MDMEKERESGNTSTKETQYRVLISKDANDSVDELLKRVNTDWEAGRITKPQLVSWALNRMAQKFSDKDLNEIRAHHFDKIAYLEALVKKAKETGQVPEGLSVAIPAASPASRKMRTQKPE